MLSWLLKAYMCLSACSHGWSLLTDACCVCIKVAKSGVKQEQQLVTPRRFLASQLSLAQRQLTALPSLVWNIKIKELSLVAWVVEWEPRQESADGTVRPCWEAGQGQLWKVFLAPLLGEFLLSDRWTFCPLHLSCRVWWWGGGMRHSCFSRTSCWKGPTSDRALPPLLRDQVRQGSCHRLHRHLPPCKTTDESAWLGCRRTGGDISVLISVQVTGACLRAEAARDQHGDSTLCR